MDGLTFFVIFSIVVFVWFAVSVNIWDKKHREFIRSIKPGDIFVRTDHTDPDDVNPFIETEKQYVEIIEIKENNSNVQFVKYIPLDYADDEFFTRTQKLEFFLAMYDKVENI